MKYTDDNLVEIHNLKKENFLGLRCEGTIIEKFEKEEDHEDEEDDKNDCDICESNIIFKDLKLEVDLSVV